MENKTKNKKNIKSLIAQILIVILITFLILGKLYNISEPVNMLFIKLNGLSSKIYHIILIIFMFISLIGIISKNKNLKTIAIFFFIYDLLTRLGFTVSFFINSTSNLDAKIQILIVFIIFSLIDSLVIFFLSKQNKINKL